MLKLSFKKQVFLGFAVSVFLVLLVGLLSYKSINQLESDSAMVEHTQKVIKTSSNLMQLLVDAETGTRGYLITADNSFLDPFNFASSGIKNDVASLKELISDNPVQVSRIDKVSGLADDQLGILKALTNTRKQKGSAYTMQTNLLLNGKNNMDEIRLLIDQVKNTEDRLLTARKASSQAAITNAVFIIITGSAIFLIIIVVLFFYIQETFEQQKSTENKLTLANGQLEKMVEENQLKNWLLTGTGQLAEKMQGEQSEKGLAENIITEMGSYCGALAGTIYLFNEDSQVLQLYGTYAFGDISAAKKTISIDEGWIGQVAKNHEPAVIKGRLNDRIDLTSSVIAQPLAESVIVPFFFDHRLKGVIELAFNEDISTEYKNYIQTAAGIIGIAVNTARARTVVHELLAQVQQQTEELESQQEELRITNEELLSKTEMLQSSEQELIAQQEELRNTNAELEEKASLLEEKNQALEEARNAIQQKAFELETTGRYKSEFLANMSHELRTPLNSILVLARILMDNKPRNLSEDQLKYADVIFNAGNDLLTLINDILDLAKIESGKLELDINSVKVADILRDMENLFVEVARNKQINYAVQTDEKLKQTIHTDKVRLQQVLKNLLSNAFKFTPDNGTVSLIAAPGEREGTLSFRIKDTGIGIPKNKQKVIFEAFQQGDGSTSRRYGGTGLGLSISRELVALLGGDITVTSAPGEGSEFVLTVPLKLDAANHTPENTGTAETIATLDFLSPAPVKIKNDNHEAMVVIVEDDKNFADILQSYAREHGYQSILLKEGAHAVETIKGNLPDAVILDIMLPGKDGWQILKELKQDAATAHIPVHLMSAGDVAANRVRHEGAISFLKKPVDKSLLDKLFSDIMQQSGTKFTQILLVEDNQAQNNALKELMQNYGISVDQAFDGASAFAKLQENEYQCIILDLKLPDIHGLDLLDKIKAIDKFQPLPVIINTAMELDKNSVARLMQYANAMVLKTNKSADRLIDEVNLFLNKVSKASAQHLPMQADTRGLKNKKVLLVDDDVRNIFAMSSALQSYGISVEIANDGQEAIEKLEKADDIDLVLMDIMMPVMDGYEATRYIRSQGKWARLPIIALTAKAMRDDKDKCIAAGASDYISKPVDIDRLVSLMQLWLEQ